MASKKTYLSKIAKGAEDLFHGRNVEQYAAICFRRSEPGSEHLIDVLLITTRESGRWVVPKGWAMGKKQPYEVAEREAWEEAGVKGKIKKRPFGFYTYMKSIDGAKTPSVVQVHLLEVGTTSSSYPEKGQRKVEWFPCFEAASLVREPELQGLISQIEKDALIKRARQKGGG